MVSVRQIEVCRRVNVWIQGHLVVEDFFSFELGGCGPGFGGVMAQHPRPIPSRSLIPSSSGHALKGSKHGIKESLIRLFRLVT